MLRLLQFEIGARYTAQRRITFSIFRSLRRDHLCICNMVATSSIHGNALNSTNAARVASLVGDDGLTFAKQLTAINHGASDYKDRRLCRPIARATERLHPSLQNKRFTISW